jgi:catechol 2,3-dioxygenase-like lactoylglutathione lyase family enzyme
MVSVSRFYTLTVHCSGFTIKPMRILHVDHIGIVVNDLEAAKTFFVDLGFALAGQTSVEGEWVGRVIGLKDVRSDIAMLKAPDGQVNIELSKIHQPADPGGIRPAAANTLGIRHIAFQVEDLEGVVNALKQKNIKLVGEIQTYQDSWKLCYVRGPEGIILELAERLIK